MADSFKDIARENFAWLRRDSEASQELYSSVLRELAGSMTSGGVLPSPTEAKELFFDLCGTDVGIFAHFCSQLTSIHPYIISKYDSDSVPKRVSYLRSHLTDKAFSRFSDMCGTLSAVYGADFKSICEDVYYERSDACILPLESTVDGLLMSFRNLLLKYELCVYAVCEVRQNDDSILTMALLTSETVFHGDRFEFYFPSAPIGTLEDINSIVRTLGGTVVRCSSITTEYSSEAELHICVRMSDSAKDSLFFCFDALYPSYMILGNY